MLQVIASDKTIDLNDLIDRLADKYISENSYFDGNPINPNTKFITFIHSEVAYAIEQAFVSKLQTLIIAEDLKVRAIATRNGRVIKDKDLVAA